MNRWEIGSLPVLSTDPEGFRNQAGESLNPTVVELQVWINGGPSSRPADTTYVFGTDALITNPIVGSFARPYDTSSLNDGDVVTYRWVGDPAGTPFSVCQALATNSFSVYA